jgi:hypothetical protein
MHAPADSGAKRPSYPGQHRLLEHKYATSALQSRPVRQRPAFRGPHGKSGEQEPGKSLALPSSNTHSDATDGIGPAAIG